MLRQTIKATRKCLNVSYRNQKYHFTGTSKIYNKEENNEQINEETKDNNNKSNETNETVTEKIPREKDLEKEINELKDKNNDLNNRLLRALADTENVRRISRQDVSNAREYSISKFAKSLLDVADNLTRAHESINIEEISQEHSLTAIKSLHEGVVMTANELEKAFGQHGIVKMGEVNEKFDPNIHEALYEYEDHSKEPGTVGQVLKVGYLINGRVLRPAQVGVLKTPLPEIK